MPNQHFWGPETKSVLQHNTSIEKAARVVEGWSRSKGGYKALAEEVRKLKLDVPYALGTMSPDGKWTERKR